MPIVPCPAITSGSSNGCTKTSPSRSMRRFASASASEYDSPCNTTSAPRRRTASTFTSGVVTGMTITARQPSSPAARATPWAWLPADEQMTPRARCSAASFAILL